MLGTPCCTYLSLVISKAHLMRLWLLMYYLLIEFQHPKCLYISIVVLSMFFFWSSPTPDLLITRWVLKIADFGLGDLLDDPPEQHLLYQAPELLRCADIFSSQAKELFSSDLRNGLLRVGVKKATSTASQLFSTKFTAGLEHYLS